MSNANQPAFPMDFRSQFIEDGEKPLVGLTKREFLTAVAMLGLILEAPPPTSTKSMAHAAVDLADAVLDKLEEKDGT